jgi:hypothetical protein
MRYIMKRVAGLVLLVFIIGIPVGCNRQGELDQPLTAGKAALASEFAPYKEVAVEEKPSLKPYAIEPELNNVENGTRFIFSADARKALVANGFVVLPEKNLEFFWVYEMNRYDAVPNLVTTDAMLHNYHLFFQHLLKTIEEEKLIPSLKQLNSGMLKASMEQLDALKNTAWENAARRNLAFFTVASRILDPKSTIPQEVEGVVNAELNLINEHQATAVSPLMSIGKTPDVLESLKEDYTQYIPRGHYTRSEQLKAYFKVMMWYGRMTFRIKDQDETRSAVLMALALQDDERETAWKDIYHTTQFFVGTSDDPGYQEYLEIINRVYGPEFTLRKLSTDQEQWQRFMEEVRTIKGPAVNSIPIFDASIQPDREHEIKGFRFMGQRYTVDADIFQRLIYREVGENPAGERRVLPKGLDVPAALGSAEAKVILKDMGDYQYQGYPENMEKLQKYLGEMEPSQWNQDLYWNWLHTLLPLTRQVAEGYPSFMCNQAWARKELNTFLGSWTELKHDSILYAKQVYAEMGGGLDEFDDRGYVEPNPRLYARLASLAAMTRDGLEARNLISERDFESLNRMEKLALDLKTISEKELQEEPLTEAEYDLIKTFGGQLEHFWMEALRDQQGGRNQLLNDNPAALVADVATAPPDLVLEEATGFVQAIYAVVPVEGKLRIAKGAVYSYYEFPWPAADRLTDQKWREMLETGEHPQAPVWTQSFVINNGECRITMPWQVRQ